MWWPSGREALAKQLEEQRRKRARLVDPLQYEMSIQAEDLAGYVPAFGWEAGPPAPSKPPRWKSRASALTRWNPPAKHPCCWTG